MICYFDTALKWMHQTKDYARASSETASGLDLWSIAVASEILVAIWRNSRFPASIAAGS